MGFCRLDVYEGVSRTLVFIENLMIQRFFHIPSHCNKIRENIDNIRSKIKPGIKILVVAKANAYGLGAAEICKHLENDVDYFAFATIEEAIEVRKSGCRQPKILLLSEPLKKDIQKAIDYKISLGVYNKNFIEYLNEYLINREDDDFSIDTHFKIDTGLQRLGNADESVLEYWLHDTCIRLRKVGLWSHLQNAEHGEVSGVTKERLR